MLIHTVNMDESLIRKKSRNFWMMELNRISSCLGYKPTSGEGKVSLGILKDFARICVPPSNERSPTPAHTEILGKKV